MRRPASAITLVVALAAAVAPLPAVAADIRPPIIHHKAVTSAVRGANVVITATMEDESEIFGATLWYRPAGKSTYTSVEMTRKENKGDLWGAAIPATGDIEYYLEAYDEFGNGPARAGSPEKPFVVSVSERAPLYRASPQAEATPPAQIEAPPLDRPAPPLQAATPPGKGPARSLALITVTNGEGVSQKQARTIEEMLLAALSLQRRFKVLGHSDVDALPSEAKKRAAGCADMSCMLQVAAALGVDLVATADASVVEKNILITLKVVDVHAASVASRSQAKAASDEDLPDAADALAQAVTNDLAAAPPPAPVAQRSPPPAESTGSLESTASRHTTLPSEATVDGSDTPTAETTPPPPKHEYNDDDLSEPSPRKAEPDLNAAAPAPGPGTGPFAPAPPPAPPDNTPVYRQWWFITTVCVVGAAAIGTAVYYLQPQPVYRDVFSATLEPGH